MSSDYLSYRNAATSILARHAGQEAVAFFGLGDVFTGPHPLDYAPAYGFLEAQGRQAATTPALGMLALAHCVDAAATGTLGFGLPFGHGPLVAVPGMPHAACVVVDRPGKGLVTLSDTTEVRPQELADDYLRIMDGSASTVSVVVPDAAMAAVRPELLARVQLGVSAEVLGVCGRLLDDAVSYAKTRRQFAQPIGDFQAVQHLLAWAATDLHQLRCLFDIAVHQSQHAADPALARAVKAMAGRTLHSVAQAAIQVTGAISFTWEYSLNRLHHRGLSLDQVAGPSADLVAQLGQSIRVNGVVPALVTLGDLTN